MKKIPKAVLVILILVLLIASDQVIKSLARDALEGISPQSYLGGIVIVQFAENTGAMLGLGGDLPPVVRVIALVIVNGILLGGGLWFLLKSKNAPWQNVAGSALLIAGGISNIIDRLYNSGAVVDYVSIGIGWLRTGIFNLADLAIMVGAGMIVLWAMRSTDPASPTAQDSE